MAQQTRKIGIEQDYPGSYQWPILEVVCPECEQWVSQYGEVSTEINGETYHLCIPCGDTVFPNSSGVG